MERILSDVSFVGKQLALKQKKKSHEQILPFVTTYHPGVKYLKNTLMHKCNLIQNQPLLRTIYLIQERQITKRDARQSKVLKLHSRESVQARQDCFTLELSGLEKTCDVIGSVHPVRKCSKWSKADQSQSRFGTLQVNSNQQGKQGVCVSVAIFYSLARC